MSQQLDDLDPVLELDAGDDFWQPAFPPAIAAKFLMSDLIDSRSSGNAGIRGGRGCGPAVTAPNVAKSKGGTPAMPGWQDQFDFYGSS